MAAEQTDVVVGPDGLARCGWCVGSEIEREYHDREWGVPVHNERGLFERLCLEAFQSGLSWLTILRKREHFRAAFANFEVDAVAAFDAADRARLLADAGIVRNRAKIDAAITNARAVAALRTSGGIAALIWSHRPEPQPAARTLAALPTKDATSTALATDLKRHGLVFVGPTTAMALMEAAGLVDHHLEGCHRRGVAAG